jgi:hypothetical protein
MTVPNHLIPLSKPGEDMEIFGKPKFWRARMMTADKGYAQPTGLVFVDDRYGLTHYGQRDTDAPATWMDPEIFLGMALEDPAVTAIAADVAKKRNKKGCDKLIPELNRLLEDAYVPYLFARFEVAKKYLAEWLVAQAAESD